MPDRSKPKSRAATFGSRWPWAILLLILLFAVAVRWRALNVPLERDEGEYAYIGQLMLKGIPPYQMAYNMKLPGTYAAYALIMAVFGQTIAGIHLGLLLVNAATIVLVFLLGRRLFDALGGLVAGAFFALMTLGPALYAMAAHANHFVVLFALAGTLALLRAMDSQRLPAYFSSGGLFGLAFLMKQHGAVFTLFALTCLLWIETRTLPFNLSRRGRRVAALMAGVIAPFLVTCAALAWAGVFAKFWFWTFSYSSKYITALSPQVGWENLAAYFKYRAEVTLLLWILAAAGLLCFICTAKEPRQKFLVLALIFFSLIGASLGFYFRPHYFLLLAPALALATGGGVSSMRQWLASRGTPAALREAPTILFAAACLYVVFRQTGFFFEFSPAEMLRATYRDGFFAEPVKVGYYIRAHSRPDARVAVLGSEPEICFYANRRSASGFMYTYSLMENAPYALELQRQMIGEIESVKPEFCVCVVTSFSWMPRPGAEKVIFDWAWQYFNRYYRQVGVIDFISPEETTSLWDADAANYKPRAKEFILVLQRNSTYGR